MELNCEDCERNFATPYTLRRHLKRTHNILELTKNPKQLAKCLSCMDNITFCKISMLIDHLNTEHGMSINEEILNFSNSTGEHCICLYYIFNQLILIHIFC